MKTVRNAQRTLKRALFRRTKPLVQRTGLTRDHQLSPVVTFVTGVPRSGTNMLMNILDRSWQTDVFHESDRRAYNNYHMRERPLIQDLAKNSKARRIVFKALLEAHQLNDLMQAFAPANGVWMFRNFDDVVNSNMVRWPGGRNLIDSIVKDPNSGGWRGLGMTPSTHKLVRSHYYEGMNDASALGLFWYYRNQLFFDQGYDNTDGVLLMRYESLVSNPAQLVAGVCEHLDVRFNTELSGMVFATSVGRAPPPDIDEPIRALCNEMMERLTDVWESRWQPR